MCLVENHDGVFLAATARRRDAQFTLQLPKIAHTGLGRVTDLLFGDGVADTDVHDFNELRAWCDLTANANDCQ